jgi:lipoprotein-anchoring transpeptidase ErfK/SrfK
LYGGGAKVNRNVLDDFEPRRRTSRFLVFVLLAVVVAAGAYWWKEGGKGRSATSPAPVPVARQEVRTAEGAPVARSEGNSASILSLLSEASELEKNGAAVEAREKYLEALRVVNDDAMRREVERKLGAIGISLLMLPRPMPEKVDYTVQAGDSVAKIAQKFGTTPELVQKSNEIQNPDLIKAGDWLRVCTGQFSFVVDRSENDLVLSLNGRFFKRYAVGTGKYGKTPVGTFVISERIPQPVWWRPDGKIIPYGDKENILGTHWLTLKATGQTEDVRGYGIHGTWDTNSVGKAESAGCIRLRNDDILELFSLLPVGTPGKIVE